LAALVVDDIQAAGHLEKLDIANARDIPEPGFCSIKGYFQTAAKIPRQAHPQERKPDFYVF
jgi:hypothetical protein